MICNEVGFGELKGITHTLSLMQIILFTDLKNQLYIKLL